MKLSDIERMAETKAAYERVRKELTLLKAARDVPTYNEIFIGHGHDLMKTTIINAEHVTRKPLYTNALVGAAEQFLEKIKTELMLFGVDEFPE